jgi:DNA-binding XRE family transcriptional regulator
MNQDEFAKFLGFTRSHYGNIEIGKFSGSIRFWNTVSEKCCIPYEEIWKYMKNE